MSNLATASTLVEAGKQLPTSWYVDQAIHELEQRFIFSQAPRYIGHELMTPDRGDYYAMEWMGNAKALIHNDNGIELISNVCRHRQAIMLDGHGRVNNIVCPLHRWTYNLKGELLGAPQFPGNPCLNLDKEHLQNWQGLLFSGPRDINEDLSGLKVANQFDFCGYKLDRVDIEEYDFNWKTFVEVYLEDYHVGPIHPGLGNFVNCDDLEWQYHDWYSVQTVGVARELSRPGTPVYDKWHQQVLRFNEGMPKQGAIWMIYYPNIMLEWYPNVLVISTVLPDGPERCQNVVEYYYPEDIALFEREFVEAHQAAYNETAIEDAQICRRMQKGRAALYKEGRNEVGPCQSPLEDGLVHFNEFIRNMLDPHLKSA